MGKISFYNIIEDTFQKNREWKYYSEKVFDYDNPIKSEENSKKFIKEFIELSEKQGNSLQETSFLQKQVKNIGNRATHIVSTFFIGHYIYQKTNFKEQIDAYLKKKAEEEWQIESSISFSFVWFLTCLFHDLGYTIEKYEKVKYLSLKDLKDKTRDLDKVDGIPNFYEEVYEDYYRYRIKYQNVNDHGITAAYLLYDSLCKIREEKENKNESYLSWESNLDKVYNFCAWNILAHNIWFCNRSNKEILEIYKYYKLDELIFEDKSITKESYKISREDYPFFFLLCLVDTIEPYKRVEKYEDLKNIFLEYSKKQINIISLTDKYTLKDAKGLNDWLVPTEIKATIKL
ncbi:hypothetical protein [Capnocytophaga genosp. AHN8471]|uniref:hypothetical protein n=1 Tax=Capnocytophaga genosp. AHN8471 TaxID=327574 RepID=UPI001933E553|nr:hypothetical protein [Capnocytophaga genosp. AHN8471]MBM0660302.1 hypothetical protein [Capnocytophaga genosp. AHN8471]